mgnify:CR=1 FL=1
MNFLALPFGQPLPSEREGGTLTVEAGLLARIRGAYLDLCERQVSKLQHEIAVEKALNEDDTLEDLEREARRLAARIAKKKAERVNRHAQETQEG